MINAFTHLAHAGVAAQVQPHHTLVPQLHSQPCRLQCFVRRLPPVDAEQQAHLDVCTSLQAGSENGEQHLRHPDSAPPAGSLCTL